MRLHASAVGLLLITCFAREAGAADIEGVLPASLDQPRIYVAISVDAKSKPLTAKGGSMEDLLGGMLGTKGDKEEETETFAVEAFLDTGASGFMLSESTAEALGIQPAKTSDGKNITFYDVGVAGKEPFLVTGAYYLRSSEYSGNTDGTTFETYSPPTGPIRLKIREGQGMLEDLMGALDVAGMPLMMGKVMVVDARPLAKMDKIKTTLVSPGDKSIPKVDTTVPLTYIDYARFTQTEPANVPSVQLAPNPMIGPDPFNKSDPTKPITITHNGKSTTLTMLLDTGAASSMISTKKAKELGIEIAASGKLTNVPEKEQFTLPIGGIGGSKDVHGFFVDVVALPSTAGEPIRYLKAPVLVMDISVTDEKKHESFTLDGVFGMNYLVASASVSVGLTGGIDDTHDGAFDFIVVDHAKKTLGLKLKK